MKKLFTLLMIGIILSLSFSANAQNDTVMYKIKYEKFKSWKRTGQIVTFTGIGITLIGAGILILGTTNNLEMSDDVYVPVTSAVAAAGTITAVVGGIYWGIGKSKTREYKIRLENIGAGIYFKQDTYYAPRSAGIVLAYRF
ncbi:MAG: hypothetical protein MUE74_06905 [Bacteroidales bacterium]|jgi:uncharacterized membrane protein|nr:hypothetical protein [Bacteroidales bacterium]